MSNKHERMQGKREKIRIFLGFSLLEQGLHPAQFAFMTNSWWYPLLSNCTIADLRCRFQGEHFSGSASETELLY